MSYKLGRPTKNQEQRTSHLVAAYPTQAESRPLVPHTLNRSGEQFYFPVQLLSRAVATYRYLVPL